MVKSDSTRVRKGATPSRKRRPRRPARADPAAILGRFAEALSLVETACNALHAKELGAIGSEESCLAQGVSALQRVYAELDSVPP